MASPSMMREYVQLAVTTNSFSTAHWWSLKLDGVRAVWIPTLRNKICPAYCGSESVLTGLFTRYGKMILAPEWFLDSLPPYPLDGELLFVKSVTTGPLVSVYVDGPMYDRFESSFNDTVSVVKRLVPEDRWSKIKFFVFDAPPYEQLFANGIVNNNIVKYHPIINSDLKQYYGDELCRPTVYSDRYQALYDASRTSVWMPLYQWSFRKLSQVKEYMEQALAVGVEGLVGRHPMSVWQPKRVPTMVKIKPFLDAEGIVTGYNAGEGKYQGMLGSYQITWSGGEFDLSGMDDTERQEPRSLGSRITFRYRTLTEAGVPREARLIRKYEGM